MIEHIRAIDPKLERLRLAHFERLADRRIEPPCSGFTMPGMRRPEVNRNRSNDTSDVERISSPADRRPHGFHGCVVVHVRVQRHRRSGLKSSQDAVGIGAR